MLVKDIMSRSVKTVSADTRMFEVVSQMCLYRYSGLPVVGDNDELVGMIAEKDVLHYLFPTLEDLMGNIAAINLDEMMDKYQDVVKLKVEEIMHPKVITVDPDMHIMKATSIMVKHRFRRIPVADGNTLVGMMSLGDVHKAIYQANISKMI
ncbi:MAG: CBS domain-containing protein [Methylococcales bacterium]|nr:CBS domain-containing protein [Methylococcales bacterium]MBT7443275.1 CBS domain-containing protein [Methylococcales bacterium]